MRHCFGAMKRETFCNTIGRRHAQSRKSHDSQDVSPSPGMHDSVLAKVAKIEAAVSNDANSQHQDKKDKERNRRMQEMINKEIVERISL
mmetsp:Transcript_4672/g.5544  ORF Transcript_4672/g.5544 Transcript_4672/m.5544 type:complete len:89 (-) Transcript_4672:15-281(-)